MSWEEETAGDGESSGQAQRIRRRVICIISPRKTAYSETFIQAHLRRLPAEVKLLHGTLGGDFPAMTADDRPLLSIVEKGLTVLLRKVLGARSTRFQDAALWRYLQREKVEAVLAEFGNTGASVSNACHAAGVPLIVHFHGADAFKQKLLTRYQGAYQRMFATAAAVIAVSRDMEQQLLTLGAPRDKLFYNPCGADTSLFVGANPAVAPPVFLAVGRFVEKKAPHLTLQAFKDVVKVCPEARLIMAGDGVLMEACSQLVRALDIVRSVEFVGARPHTEVAALMRKVRGFVIHSITASDGDAEGTPVAVLEAGVAGLPVVSTRHAGIKDAVIHKETGFLVDEGDIRGMAGYMVELIRDPGLASRLGQRAREHVRANFSMEKSLAALWRIIEGVLPRNGS